MSLKHIWQNEDGKSIWQKTFALGLEDLICFSMENNKPALKARLLAKYSHFLLLSALLTNHCDTPFLTGEKWCVSRLAKQFWALLTKNHDLSRKTVGLVSGCVHEAHYVFGNA